MGGESVRKILNGTKPKTVGMFIGSEGGFEQSEVDSVTAIGGQAATLGKRILRAETAPLPPYPLLCTKPTIFRRVPRTPLVKTVLYMITIVTRAQYCMDLCKQ